MSVNQEKIVALYDSPGFNQSSYTVKVTLEWPKTSNLFQPRDAVHFPNNRDVASASFNFEQRLVLISMLIGVTAKAASNSTTKRTLFSLDDVLKRINHLCEN